MKIYKIANDVALKSIYDDLNKEMVKVYEQMNNSPKIPEDSLLIDKSIYGRTYMLSGKVAGYEECLDRILAKINENI